MVLQCSDASKNTDGGANSVCPDQTAPERAVGSGLTLFALIFQIFTLYSIFHICYIAHDNRKPFREIQTVSDYFLIILTCKLPIIFSIEHTVRVALSFLGD